MGGSEGNWSIGGGKSVLVKSGVHPMTETQP